MDGNTLWIGAAGVGATLITMYMLDAHGVITVNTRAIRVAVFGGAGYVGYRFLELLTTFI